MKSDYEMALRIVLKSEGGFVNHPADKGGPTNKGITQRTYDRWRKDNDLTLRSVKLIESHSVRDIYEQDYWFKAECDEMEWPLSLVHFDGAVNHGVRKESKFLQEIVGVRRIVDRSLRHTEWLRLLSLLWLLEQLRQEPLQADGRDGKRVWLLLERSDE